MLKVSDVVEVIKIINMNYSYEMPFYLYNKDLDMIVDEKTPNLDEMFINNEMIPFNIRFFASDIVYLYLEKIKDEKLKQELEETYQGHGRFKKFKMKLIEYNLVNDYFEFKENYYKTLAINWLIENNIDFER